MVLDMKYFLILKTLCLHKSVRFECLDQSMDTNLHYFKKKTLGRYCMQNFAIVWQAELFSRQILRRNYYRSQILHIVLLDGNVNTIKIFRHLVKY